MSGAAAEALHACAVSVSAEQQAEVAARFVAREVAAGRRVAVLGLATEAGALARRLREDGADPEGALARGRLCLCGEDESTALLALPEERFDRWLAEQAGAAERDGCTGLAVVTGSLVPRGGAHEASLDGAVRTRGTTVLCLYARALVDAEAVARVRALHRTSLDEAALLDDGVLRLTTGAPGLLRLAGELDLSNRAVVAAALRASAPWPGRLELDLASLRFVDAGGAAMLLALAGSTADGHLRVRRARPSVRRVLDLVDVDGVLRAEEGTTR